MQVGKRARIKKGWDGPPSSKVEVRRLLQVPDPPRHLLALMEGKTMHGILDDDVDTGVGRGSGRGAGRGTSARD